MRVLALALLAALPAAPACAQPYRWVDEHGGVHYADRAPQPAPPGLENLNPAARQRRADPPQSTPEPGAASRPELPAPPARRVAPPPAEARPAPIPEPPKPPPQRVAPPPVAARPAPIPEPPSPPPQRVAPPPAEARPAPTGPDRSRVVPGAAREEGREVARELMELAGIDRYLEDLARGAQGDLARLAWSTREPNAAWAALIPVVRRDVLAAATAAVLARRLETDHLPAVLAWLRSPEHQRIRQAEIEAAKPASHHLYRRFVAGLVETNAKLQHLSLIQQLERAGRGTDRHLALERALRQAMQRAVAPLASHSGDDEADEPDPRAEERTRFWRMTGTLFAYRGLGSAQLEAALRFERSPAGQWFTAVAWESLEEAVLAVEQRATAAIRSVAARSLSRR